MKILIVSNEYTIHVERWLNGLRARGHRVKVFLRESADDPAIHGAPRWMRRFPLLHRGYLGLLFRRLLRTFQPDIVHQHWFEVRPIMAWVPPTVPIVISVWGSDIVRAWTPEELAQARAYVKCAAAVLASSDFLRTETEKWLQCPVERIYWGIDLTRFTPQPNRRTDTAFRLVFMKHLKPVYGPDIAIAALPAIRAAVPDAHLDLYGEGAMRGELQAQADALGVTDAVHFHGWARNENVPQILSDSDVMVMPSRAESLGMAAMEAQAVELPVIATTVGGIPEVVKDEKGGILIPPEDAGALAAAAIRLARDPALRRRMGEAGRQYVLAHFDWQDTLAQTEAVYRRVRQQTSTPAHDD